MATGSTPFLQPSSSSLATAIAAAFNIVGAHKASSGVIGPQGPGAETAKRWAELVGECAKIIVDKVKDSGAP